MVATNKSEVKLLDINAVISDIRLNIINSFINLNTFNSNLNVLLEIININIPINQDYINSQIKAIELLILIAQKNITNLIKQTSNSNIINSLNAIFNEIQNINTIPNIDSSDYTNLSKFYQNRIEALIMLLILHQVNIF